jgi:hypothetical protein
MGRMFKLVKIVKSQSELSTEDGVNDAPGPTSEGYQLRMKRTLSSPWLSAGSFQSVRWQTYY